MKQSLVPDAYEVDAFVSMGGNPDKSGTVDKDRIRAVIEQFELTIDIQEFLDQVREPQLDFREFCTLFDQPFDDSKSQVSLRTVKEFEIRS
jgi:hypothetical protein